MALSSRFSRPASPTDETAKKGGLTAAQSIAGNVAMFIVAAVLCYFLVSGFRGLAFPGKPAGYSLVTTRQVEAGEHFSTENAMWRPITGRAPAGVLTGKTATDPLGNYIALTRIAGGKLVRSGIVAKISAPASRTDATLAGYILTGSEIADVVPFLKEGDRLDVIAIVTPEGGKGASLSAHPLVGTVLTGALVTSVAHGMGVGRNSSIGSVVIGVTDEQARFLGLLRRYAALQVVLSPMRPEQARANQPATLWQSIDELRLPFKEGADEAKAAAAAPLEPASAPSKAVVAQPVVAQPAQPLDSVAVITPGGVTHAALSQ